VSSKDRDIKSRAPASNAGLLTFFQEDSKGFKVDPTVILVSMIAFISIAVLLNLVGL
jgi:preprotein translocase subunit Sec61beta